MKHSNLSLSAKFDQAIALPYWTDAADKNEDQFQQMLHRSQVLHLMGLLLCNWNETRNDGDLFWKRLHGYVLLSIWLFLCDIGLLQEAKMKDQLKKNNSVLSSCRHAAFNRARTTSTVTPNSIRAHSIAAPSIRSFPSCTPNPLDSPSYTATPHCCHSQPIPTLDVQRTTSIPTSSLGSNMLNGLVFVVDLFNLGGNGPTRQTHWIGLCSMLLQFRGVLVT